MNRLRTVLAVALAGLLVAAGAASVGATDASTWTTGSTAAQASDHPGPDDDGPPDGDASDRLERLLSRFDLTDDQVDSIVREAEAMHENGASSAEIKEMVHAKLNAYGVSDAEIRETLRDGPADRRFDRLQHRFDLTAEQTDTLRETVTELREANASRAEVARAVVDELRDYGATEGELWTTFGVAKVDHLQSTFDLTDAQARAVAETVRDLRDDGATAPEVHHAVIEQLDASGATDEEIRAYSWDTRLLRLQAHLDLTDAQTDVLRGTVRDALADGASTQDIRQALRDDLREMDVDRPGHRHAHRHGHHRGHQPTSTDRPGSVPGAPNGTAP